MQSREIASSASPTSNNEKRYSEGLALGKAECKSLTKWAKP